LSEGSKQGSRDAAGAGVSSDWVARELGDTWIEVEPGIYEHRPATPEGDVEPENTDRPQELLPRQRFGG
jgi:hypothetical protein